MKLTRVQPILLSFPFPEPIRLPFYGGERTILKRDAMLIRVQTSTGITGYAPGPGSELVHNAIRHRAPSSEAGHVAVIVARAPLRITIKSDGGVIDEAALASLRTGSVPSDVARTRGRGLGLSIVRKVAALHGLDVGFARGEGDSLEVTLSEH